MDIKQIAIWGAVAYGAYWVYEKYYATTATTTTSTTPTLAQYEAAGLSQAQALGAQALGLTVAGAVAAYTPTSTATTAVPATTASTATTATTATTTAASSVSVLDAYYTALKAAAAPDTGFTGSGDSLSSTPDHWNFYLKSVTGYSAPIDSLYPGDASAAIGANTRTTPVTAAQFWAMVSPGLATSKGLSGLGVFGGLGQIGRRYQRGWN